MTEDELIDPANYRSWMKPDDWFLRTMILEFQRRGKVIRGEPDPHPGKPWMICTPEAFLSQRRATAEEIEDQWAAGKRRRI